jgi:hypothetical protein
VLQALGRVGHSKDLRYCNEPEKWGPFAAFELPEIFVDGVRAAFRVMRLGVSEKDRASAPTDPGWPTPLYLATRAKRPARR